MVKKKQSSYWNNRKVLITGHEGFLGSWLTRSLVEQGADLCGIDIDQTKKSLILKDVRGKFKSIYGDVGDYSFVSDKISTFNPQVVFHLAAEAIVGTANKNPLKTFHANIQGTWNILEASRDKDFIESIVVASSDKAYGTHKKLPYTELAALQGEHPYDVSKSCADLICRSYFVTFGIPVCVTRCGNIYGPGDYNFSRLIPDAIRSFILNQQFMIRSNGKFTRDYIFVQDVVDAYMLLAQSIKKFKLAGQAFNFSCETPISVLKLFQKLKSISAKNIPPKILNQAKNEIPHQYLSSTKAKKILKWKPQYSLDEGLKETFAWYKIHLENMS